MSNAVNDRDSTKKYKSGTKKKSGLRVKADKKIVSDVLGAYTGTPVNAAPNPDIYDLYPEQDADDL